MVNFTFSGTALLIVSIINLLKVTLETTELDQPRFVLDLLSVLTVIGNILIYYIPFAAVCFASLVTLKNIGLKIYDRVHRKQD